MDLAALNAAPRGTYWPGNADDISVPEMRARGDLATINELISKWEGELSQAFLLSSVRDAERVTAAEIRMIANELESAFGGLYSQLAQSWQQREAEYAISKVDFEAEIGKDSSTFEVLVTTGLESLSREGQIDNLRLAIGDLQMMEAVPEDMYSPTVRLTSMPSLIHRKRCRLTKTQLWPKQAVSRVCKVKLMSQSMLVKQQ